MFVTVDIPANDSNRHTLGLHTWTAGQLQTVLCQHKSLCRAADWQRRLLACKDLGDRYDVEVVN